MPLLQLIKKEVPWNWDKAAQESFQRVKRLFSESILLYFPDPRTEYYSETDARNYALGAVLYPEYRCRYFTIEK